MAAEYRVVWKRVGLRPKHKRYVARPRAERFITLLTTDEPWLLFDKRDPDELYCCPGTEQYECGCGGITVREMFTKERENMPALEYVRLERREVGAWIELRAAQSERGTGGGEG